MRRKSSLAAAFAALALLVAAAPSAAQITINIPKIPKIKKDKPTTTTTTPPPTTTTTTTNTPVSDAARTAAAKPEPAGPKDCSDDAVAQIHLKDLGETRAEAEEYRPGLRNYFVSTLSDSKNLYLEAALIPSERKAWLGKWPTDFQNCMNTALDGLADAARKTITGYHGPAGYTLGTPAEKKLLLSAINDLSEGKVLRSGIRQANWLISKDNYNFPTARYKHGYVLIQYPKREHGGFCWVFWINVVQDYAGGGTYGASYGNFISRSMAGCPAAAK